MPCSHAVVPGVLAPEGQLASAAVLPLWWVLLVGLLQALSTRDPERPKPSCMWLRLPLACRLLEPLRCMLLLLAWRRPLELLLKALLAFWAV